MKRLVVLIAAGSSREMVARIVGRNASDAGGNPGRTPGGRVSTVEDDRREPRMSDAPPPLYRKYAYWAPPEAALAWARAEEARKVRLYRAREKPCEVLFPRRAAAIVSPEVWDRQCRRQGSWYRESALRGRHLVVSNDPAPGLADFAAAVITLAPFVPPRYATLAEARAMREDPAFRAKEPADWSVFRPGERETLRAYLDGAGIREDVEDVFTWYCANHANFISPRLFVREGGLAVPYSIERTPRLCSACLELFNVVGAEFPVKYLRRCPGLFYVETGEDLHFRVMNPGLGGGVS